MQIFLFFALLIALVAILFAAQNNQTTTVTLAFWKFDSSLALLLGIALVAGAMMSFFFSLPANIRARWTIRQQRKRMGELESSLTESQNKAQLSPAPEPKPGKTGEAASYQSEVTSEESGDTNSIF